MGDADAPPIFEDDLHTIWSLGERQDKAWYKVTDGEYTAEFPSTSADPRELVLLFQEQTAHIRPNRYWRKDETKWWWKKKKPAT